ncbi:related to 6-methylsalicylic acid synthase [Phialocephala subalpina]|uniref:Related to 6-methylsalicylic acid synthase n=1 Tax=Phialocephala subalpina TaxID=576137 RepID=A0A1L7X721_9HELO|nr:related to 6-methylsalicylic acid synthase [Phialocephala subalpina]
MFLRLLLLNINNYGLYITHSNSFLAGLTKVLDAAGAISPLRTCCSFDDGAQGYVRGEGAAVVILKRLEDAIRDRDQVLAVIEGSAVGRDGCTLGKPQTPPSSYIIIVPNCLRQYADFYIVGIMAPNDIQYIKAHATSTRVGDPVEVRAMSRVYGVDRAGQACYIDSAKPNIGHLEAGSGVVGFMKAVLSIQNGIIAPQANVQILNQTVNHKRRAAVCSCGYGGSVSHLALESAPHMSNEVSETQVPDYSIILLSAPQQKRLVAGATALSEWISETGKSLPRSTIANTLASRREHHDFRLGFVVTSHEHAIDSIKRYTVDMGGKVPKNTKNSQIIQNRCFDDEYARGAVWLFSGHGAQWSDMGKELLEKDPVFSATIQELEPIVRGKMEFSIMQMLRDGSFPSTEQGAKPAAIIGHSVGETAAAVVAGVLAMRDGCLIACRRGIVFRKFNAMDPGTMALVTGISFIEMVELLHGQTDIFAAIDSSPTSCVVSGKREAISRYTERWEKDDIKVTKIESDVPFHSELIAYVAPKFSELLRDIKPTLPTIADLYRTTTEDPRYYRLRDAAYWIDNMLHPVLLRGGIQDLADDGYRVFVESSTHPIITNSVTETLDDLGIDDHAVISTIIRNQSSQRVLLASLVAIWSVGTPIEWKSMFQGVDWAKGVPKTKFNRLRYWKEVETGPTDLIQMHDVHKHTLLGRPIPTEPPTPRTEIIPAAVLINTFLTATGSRVLTDMRLRVPVAVNAPRDVQVIFEKDSVRLMSRLIQSGELDENGGKSWFTHTTAATKASALLGIACSASERTIDIQRIQEDLGRKLKDDHTEDYLADVGVAFMGFPWKVTRHFANKGQILARVVVCPDLADGQQPDWDPLSWAPVLDAVTSIGSTSFYRAPALRMPSQIASVAVTEGAVPPKIAFVHVRDASTDDKKLAAACTTPIDSSAQLPDVLKKFQHEQFAIFCIPRQVESYDNVPEASRGFCKELLDIFKYILENKLPIQVFAITDDSLGAINATALAHASLLGLSRIIAAEHQDVWGALIDVDFECFPFQVVEHMDSSSAYDVEDNISPRPTLPPLHPQPAGIYLITSGLRALSLEVATWMVKNEARRIILVSRHNLPPRKEWESQTSKMSDIIKQIKVLENRGAIIYSVAVDLSTLAAKATLTSELERLSLPPIRSVVHAAGIASNEMVHNTTTKHFNEVLDPKITGALVLHTLFPANTLDFFILFSSCGQLFGFPGQAAYASGNAFLDSLATHRRDQGDNAIAFQWTSWKGLGMAAPNDASKDVIDEELAFKVITDINRDEAFEAWDVASKLSTDHATVLHTLEVKSNQPLRHLILEDVVVQEGTERIKNFADTITGCVAKCLDIEVDEVDSKKALLEMRMDSVILLMLRKGLQAAIGVVISPTLVWSCPTVGHLAKHFAGLDISPCPKSADVV